jgi:transcriptional regulator with XRE-family HTH domain
MSRDATTSKAVPDEKAAKSAQSRHVTDDLAPEKLVRERRLVLGLTQAAAAAEAGISRVEWNQMENGRRGIGPKNAVRFAEVLGGEASDYVTRPSRADIDELRNRVEILERRQAEMVAELRLVTRRYDT